MLRVGQLAATCKGRSVTTTEETSMRMMSIALTGMAFALAGVLAVGTADSAFAKSKKEATQNGVTSKTEFENPDRVVQPCSGGSCYRSSKSSKHKKHHSS
jgi:hypothetical protein